LTACVSNTIRSVRPSGGDFATDAAPTEPPAPGLFSTITGWPRLSASLGDTRRATPSTVPPAGHGTTSFTGFVG